MTDLLHPLLARAVASVPEAVGAGIDVYDHDGGRSVATAGCADVLDDLQWKVDEGPAPYATSTYEVVTSEDLRSDERWPRLGDEITRVDGLETQEIAAVARPGPWPGYGFTVFTFYLRRPPAPEVLHEIAHHEAPAAVALAVIEGQGTQQDELVRAVVRARGAIEQAKGIVMGRVRCSPDEAFDVLRLASQKHNVKVRDVAAALVQQVNAPSTTDETESPTEKVARTLWESLPQ